MTLTEVVYYIRKIFPFAVLCTILIFILYVIYKIAELSTPVQQAAVMPTPTPAFGKLPALAIDSPRRNPAEIEYFIDTIQGVPETATSAAAIYFVPKKVATFGFREKASVLAKALGFDDATQRTQLQDSIYTVVDNARRLKFEIDTFNFEFSQDITDETKRAFVDVVMPSEDVLKSKAVDLVRQLNRYPTEIAKSTQTVTYFRYPVSTDSANLKTEIVQDPSLSNMVEVDFFPPKIDAFETVTSNYFTSPNYIVFSPQKSGDDFVVNARIKVYELSTEQSSIYPLRTGDDALAALSAGKGYLISGSLAGVKRVNINRTYTAYLVPTEYTEYIQPVYVFVGDHEFVAYVPAVQPLWGQE